MKWTFITERKLMWGFILLIVGIPLTIIGVGGVFFLSSLGPLADVVDGIGSWKFWLCLIGPALFFIGLWYTYDTITSVREFNKYMDTDSKAQFVKNRDHLEELVWKLGTKYQDQYIAKKKEYRIR